METSRRQFIQTSAVAATVGALGLSARADEQENIPENRGRIYKAVKGGGRGGKERMIKQLNGLKELGFDGVESVSPGISNRDDFVAAIKETGMPAHGVVDMVHWNQRLSSPDAAIREKGRKALEQAVRDAHYIGGSSVLLVPGRVAGEKETHEDVWNRSIEEVRKVLPVAGYLGIHILIETVWNGFCYDPEKFRDYIDAFNSPWVGAYFDIGNMQKFAPAHEWIRILGKRTVKLDVKDWGVKPGFC
ncbi:MAG: TIM barrel protein, partial [Verrucomicrobiota bacterium]